MSSPLRTSALSSISSFRRPQPFPKKCQNTCSVGKPRVCFVGRLPPCKATINSDQNPSNLDPGAPHVGKILDRRNVLIGLGAGGLYGAAGLDPSPFAFADPIPPPDINTCTETTDPKIPTQECCPPKPDKIRIIDFQLPASQPAILRKRRAAQDAAKDRVYVANYKEAIRRMKSLDINDPRSFWSQANVHCAYCEGSYHYGEKKLEIQVHSSWLFYPFHRLYLYFYERILASLIKERDPNFALPFWNWDAPEGMYMPTIFEEDGVINPLYDPYRNDKHRRPGTIVDLNYGLGMDNNSRDTDTIENYNLFTMHNKMLSGARWDWCLFFGHPYRAGDNPNPGAGNIELVPHNTVHDWTGTTQDSTQGGVDMGIFYSAGRDPVFYAHHANVDRMWYLWKNRFGGKDIKDLDWLDTEFLFYDENKQLMRVKVRDSLDTALLGYEYQSVEIPWIDDNFKPTARFPTNKTKPQVLFTEHHTKFPFTLDSTISVEVARPVPRRRSDSEKAKQQEVLVVGGIGFPANESVKFDVYVNDDADSPSGLDKSEFAGSFVHIPHRHKEKIQTKLTLGITQLLEDLRGEEDSSVVVTLVPRVGIGKVTLSCITIELSACPNQAL